MTPKHVPAMVNLNEHAVYQLYSILTSPNMQYINFTI